MGKKLTKIEVLDQQFPGLADQVRKWLAQGISAPKITPLLFEKYQVSVAPRTVGGFRSRRWVPEQVLLREKKISARAAEEVAREREIKMALACKVPGDVE